MFMLKNGYTFVENADNPELDRVFQSKINNKSCVVCKYNKREASSIRCFKCITSRKSSKFKLSSIIKK